MVISLYYFSRDMKENLLFLFLTGIVFGSGPCLVSCAPLLMSYTALFKKSIKDSAVSYFVFSLTRLISYCLLGALCGIFSGILNSTAFSNYLDIISILLGVFILVIGISTLFPGWALYRRFCSIFHKGNIKNVGLLGFLIGFSPCLPLFGILNYIIIISHNWLNAVIFAFAFGLGTVISPLLLLAIFSGKLAGYFSQNRRINLAIRIGCACLLIFLSGRIILQRLLH